MINDVERGGCVLATCENEAKNKVRLVYDEMIAIGYQLENFEIEIWEAENIMEDVVEVYPF